MITEFNKKIFPQMADPDTLIKAKIHYFGREKYYRQMQIAAVEGMKRFSGDPGNNVISYFCPN